MEEIWWWVLSGVTEMFCMIESSGTALGCLGKETVVTFPASVERCLQTHAITDNPKLLSSQELRSDRSLQRRLCVYLTPFTALLKPSLLVSSAVG